MPIGLTADDTKLTVSVRGVVVVNKVRGSHPVDVRGKWHALQSSRTCQSKVNETRSGVVNLLLSVFLESDSSFPPSHENEILLFCYIPLDTFCQLSH